MTLLAAYGDGRATGEVEPDGLSKACKGTSCGRSWGKPGALGRETDKRAATDCLVETHRAGDSLLLLASVCGRVGSSTEIPRASVGASGVGNSNAGLAVKVHATDTLRCGGESLEGGLPQEHWGGKLTSGRRRIAWLRLTGLVTLCSSLLRCVDGLAPARRFPGPALARAAWAIRMPAWPLRCMRRTRCAVVVKVSRGARLGGCRGWFHVGGHPGACGLSEAF